MNINQYIDHTQLKPEATPAQIKQLCKEARTYKFAAVCVNPAYVELAATELAGISVAVCTVVGFPLGTNTTRMKAVETDNAVANGANEIDMVIHIGQLKAKNFDYVEQDIAEVVKAATPRAKVKVILETCLLTDAEIQQACLLVKKAGADFVKTSTGFNKAGATVEHVKIMRDTVGPAMGVKAAGGIRDYKTALKMIEAGATRVGASASVAIVTAEK